MRSRATLSWASLAGRAIFTVIVSLGTLVAGTEAQAQSGYRADYACAGFGSEAPLFRFEGSAALQACRHGAGSSLVVSSCQNPYLLLGQIADGRYALLGLEVMKPLDNRARVCIAMAALSDAADRSTIGAVDQRSLGAECQGALAADLKLPFQVIGQSSSGVSGDSSTFSCRVTIRQSP